MRFEFRPVDPPADAALLHSWVTRPYARYWMMQEASPADVEAEYAGIAANPDHDAFLGLENGEPAFLMESYAPAASPLAAHYDVAPGDRGMHLLVGPPDTPRPGYTSAVFAAVMQFLFADPAVERIVVEPDVRNTKIHALNERYGFRPAGDIRLPEKTARLSFCTRAQFTAALQGVSA